MRLDDRKLRVLSAIVQDYVQTAEPVSSRTIVKKYKLGVSPATVRNEMSDLEELGYLEQPHTSAGRVPSDKGYRLYVDKLMKAHKLSDEELRLIRERFRKRAEQVESLMQTTARVLSDVTRCLTVVSGPSPMMAKFRALYMHLISAERALMVVLTDIGLIENAILEVPPGTTEEDLKMISEVLTTRLIGMSIDRIGQAATRELDSELRKYRIILEQMFEIIRSWLSGESDGGLYFDGTLNIMTQPEFHDIEKVKILLSVLEKQNALANIFNSGDPERVSIAIGRETGVPQMHDCSVVWTTFRAAGKVLGAIGVLGPRRMDYARVMSLLDYAREHVSEALSRNVG